MLIVDVGFQSAYYISRCSYIRNDFPTDNDWFNMRNAHISDIVEKPVKLNREITCDGVKAMFGS